MFSRFCRNAVVWYNGRMKHDKFLLAAAFACAAAEVLAAVTVSRGPMALKTYPVGAPVVFMTDAPSIIVRKDGAELISFFANRARQFELVSELSSVASLPHNAPFLPKWVLRSLMRFAIIQRQ